jgi:hypothetical protein
MSDSGDSGGTAIRPPFLAGVSFQAIAWDSIAATSQPGTSGVATIRASEVGPFRLRCIDYSAAYRSDHYCELGHTGFVVAGEIEMVMPGRAPVRLSAGMAFAVGSGMEPHLVVSDRGARLFVVD